MWLVGVLALWAERDWLTHCHACLVVFLLLFFVSTSWSGSFMGVGIPAGCCCRLDSLSFVGLCIFDFFFLFFLPFSGLYE